MEKFITTPDGLSLWTESFGRPEHPPILLVMGAMNQGIFWPDGFCEALAAAGFYVVRYDHRDTGQSSTVDFQSAPYDLDTLTDDAVAVIHGHRLVRPTVVGLSMGGYIAQLMAVRHPGIASRLVLISSTADHRPYMAATMGQSHSAFTLPKPERIYLDYLLSAARHPPRTHAETLQSMVDGWAVTYGGSRPFPRAEVTHAIGLAMQRSSSLSAGFHHALAVAASPHRLELVLRIATPTLVIHGRHDPLLPLPHGNYLAHHIPLAQLEVLDMGHAFMWSWDAEVLSLVQGFISQNPTQPPQNMCE
jgi:pimeloyl-ACP methyl ester carboxylesterase